LVRNVWLVLLIPLYDVSTDNCGVEGELPFTKLETRSQPPEKKQSQMIKQRQLGTKNLLYQEKKKKLPIKRLVCESLVNLLQNAGLYLRVVLIW